MNDREPTAFDELALELDRFYRKAGDILLVPILIQLNRFLRWFSVVLYRFTKKIFGIRSPFD